MAEKLPTPTCEVSGLPLPVLPIEPREIGALSLGRKDYHHHFHPHHSPHLLGLEGKALRYCRGQRIARSLHEDYHRVYGGPQIPVEPKEIFKTVVFALAGVMPREAINVKTFEKVELTPRQFFTLASPRSIYFEGARSERHSIRTTREIGRFFADYALRQDFMAAVPERDIEEFLYPKTNSDRRIELGNSILSSAVGASIDDLVPLHKELRREGYVTKQREALWNTVGRFFVKRVFPDYHEQVATRLTTATSG